MPDGTVVGEHASLVTSTGAFTESEVETELVPSVAATVADCGAFNIAAVAENMTVEAPTAAVTDVGTVRAAVFVLVRATAAPPLGAGAVKVTIPVEEPPPVTLAEASVNDDTPVATFGTKEMSRK